MLLVTPLRSKVPAVIGVVALLALAGPAAPAWSADQPKPAKKEKAARAAKPTAGKPAGGDLAAKGQACFGDTPRIEKVKPDTVKAGDKVRITGANFGARGCLRSVSFGPGNPAKFTHESETAVTAVVPPVKKKGMALLSVTTASGEASTPVLVK
jgi:hypothetical protein